MEKISTDCEVETIRLNYLRYANCDVALLSQAMCVPQKVNRLCLHFEGQEYAALRYFTRVLCLCSVEVYMLA